MNRMEFMSELGSLLSDIPYSEREGVLQYYNDYLDDAGVENWDEVTSSLDSPKKIAESIKAGLSGNEEGEFTENGYQDFEEEKNTITQWEQYGDKKSESEEKTTLPATKKKLTPGMIILIIILCILFAPALISVAAGILSAIIGVLAGVFGVVISLIVVVGLLAIALPICGIVMLGLGIVNLFVEPLGGAMLLGLGLLALGTGLVFIACTVWVIGKGIPGFIRLIVNLFNKIIGKRKGNQQ